MAVFEEGCKGASFDAVHPGSQDVDRGDTDASCEACAVSGAGLDNANGLYINTGRVWHEVAVFENSSGCILSREPHRNQKTGRSSYGWILGQDGTPLYAVQSESLVPPGSGWRKFKGLPPAPQVQRFASVSLATAATSQVSKNEVNEFEASKTDSAEKHPAKEQPDVLKKEISAERLPVRSGDRRTAREMALDAEEARERHLVNTRVIEQLKLIALNRRGEPTRFEQAATEVYCWWTLPHEVSGKDVMVKCSKGGLVLTITVRDVIIFDHTLFDYIKADSTLWCLQDHELNLTLTKAVRDKLWEQLSQVPDIKRDNIGDALPESVPEPMSAAQRVQMFKQMLSEDDGERPAYEDLDRTNQKYVDAIRRFEHARATGNEQALALAEMDLEEFGRVVI